MQYPSAMNFQFKSVLIMLLLVSNLPLSYNWDGEIDKDDPDSHPDLILLKAEPLDINNATKAELQMLPWLSNEQIMKIINSRRDKPFKNNLSFETANPIFLIKPCGIGLTSNV